MQGWVRVWGWGWGWGVRSGGLRWRLRSGWGVCALHRTLHRQLQQPRDAAAERVQRAAPANEHALAQVVPLPRRVLAASRAALVVAVAVAAAARRQEAEHRVQAVRQPRARASDAADHATWLGLGLG